MTHPYSLRGLLSTLVILTLGVYPTLGSGQSFDPETGEEIPLPSLSSIPHDAVPTGERGESLALIGRLADGETRGIDLVGDILYRSNGGYMEALDVSEPESPVVLGRFLVDDAVVMSVTVEGDYAYVSAQRPNVFGDRGSLQIVDVSDPSNPVGVGAITGRGFYSTVVEGSTIYAAALGGGLRIYDASNPAEPEELGFVTISGGSVLNVVKNGDIAYVAGGGSGMHAIDVSDPADPSIVGSFSVDLYPDFSEFATDVFYADGYAYVSAQPLGLIIVDVSDPTDPVEASHYLVTDQGNGQIRTVVVDGNTAFLGYDYGVIALDVSNKENVTRIGSVDFGGSGSGQSILLDGSRAWVGNRYHGVRIVDISDPAQMEEESIIWNGGFSFKVKVVDDMVYVSDLLGQLRLVDISDPTNPVLRGRLPGLFSPSRLDVVGDVVYLTHNGTFEDPTGEVTRIDVSDPSNPTIIDVTPTSTYANSADVRDGIAFVAGGQSGTGEGQILAYDAETMTLLGSGDAGNTAFDVKVVDDLAYVATFGSGLTILDVSDPAGMTPLSMGEIGGIANAVEVDGSTLYMADRSFVDARGLTVIDVSNPASPQELGTGDVMAGGQAVDVAHHAHYAYVTVDMVGVYQYDVSDPMAVTQTAFHITANRATGVDTQDEFVIVVDTGTGVWIYEAPGAVSSEDGAVAETLVLEGAYPNPFVGQTTLSYRLATADHVSVTVHDLLGRQVQTLVEGTQPAGMHEIVLSAAGLASGVYFVRVTSGGESVVRQVTLLR